MMLRTATLRLFFAATLTGWFLWPDSGQAFRTGQAAPEITAGPWINSKPLTINDLKGRVVLIEFWTYG